MTSGQLPATVASIWKDVESGNRLAVIVLKTNGFPWINQAETMSWKKLFESLDYLHIVAVSKWLEGKLKRSFLKDRPITVIHNGIDFNTFCPQTSDVYEQYGIEKHRKIVLDVSAVWDERKGLNDFFELAKNLMRRISQLLLKENLKETS